jgi:hypothetical protein
MNPATISGIMGGTVSHASWLAGWSDPAPEGPRLPRRTVVDAYCKHCGRTGSHWAGCDGQPRVGT